MIIYRPNGQALISIDIDDESYHYAEIMGRDDVTLYFSLPQYIEFPVGCYITYMAKNYTLYAVDKMRMEHRRDFEYTITFESSAVELENYIYTNPNDGRFKFPLAASSEEHLSILCRCLSLKTGVTWSVGSSVDGGDKLISYDSMTCMDALKQIADAFETEYRIDGHSLYLGKVEFYKNVQDQVPISYGKGNGLRPGVERVHDDTEKVIGRVYIQGGERNIDYSQYGSATLLLPDVTGWQGSTVWYDGTTKAYVQFDGALPFKVAEDKRSVYLATDDAPVAEGALDLTDIYPYYEHRVTSVTEADSENHIWQIVGNNFSSMDYGSYLIANDENMTIIFQSGALVGREFAVQWVPNDGSPYMEIIPSEQDGYTMPDRTSGFYPAVTDKFRVFNCYLPDEYVEAAELEMFDAALDYLWNRCHETFAIKGEVDPIWSASRWLNIGEKFKPGAYFRFTDPAWETDGVSIRITSVKTYINKPHKPIVEMSNAISRQSVSTQLQKVSAEAKVLPAASTKESKSFAKRGWADAKETMEMLINAGLDYFTEAINPIAVQTMQLLVGDESLQIKFWQSRSCTPGTEIQNPFLYNASTKKMTAQACALQHMTLGIKDIKPSSSRSVSEYKRWNMIAYESAVLDDPDKAYYVYAKCDKLNNGTNHLAGSFIISETSKPMDGDTSKDAQGNRIMEDAGYYFFLCGILNAERDNDRSFARLYGFTEILPGQVTTEVIRGSSGESWWDLVQNEFRCGDYLNYSPANGLTLNNTLVVTGSGDAVILGAYCGAYDSSRTYKLGDEVYYTVNGVTSTYRWKYATEGSGIDPTNTTYWQVVAAGVKGGDGDDGVGFVGDPVVVYSNPVPSGTVPPSDWRSEQQGKPTPEAGKFIWSKYTYTYSDSTQASPHTQDVYYAEYCASNGTPGANGLNGPFLYYRGDFDSNATYYGTDNRCDVVYYPTDGKWYMAIQGKGEIDGSQHPPYDTEYWSSFMGNFANIATGLLLADLIYVDKLGVRNLETYSPSSGHISATGNSMEMYDASGNKKMLISGSDLTSLSSNSTDTETIYFGYAVASSGVISNSDDVASLTIASSENTVTLPDLTITCSYSKVGSDYETLTASASYLVDGQQVSSGTLGMVELSTGTDSYTFTLKGRKLNLPVGSGGTATHTITVQMQGNSSGTSLQQMSWSWGTINISYGSDGVEIGANGFRVAFSTSEYFSAVKDWATSAIRFECRNGNYGLRITSTGIEKWNSSTSTWVAASL